MEYIESPFLCVPIHFPFASLTTQKKPTYNFFITLMFPPDFIRVAHKDDCELMTCFRSPLQVRERERERTSSKLHVQWQCFLVIMFNTTKNMSPCEQLCESVGTTCTSSSWTCFLIALFASIIVKSVTAPAWKAVLTLTGLSWYDKEFTLFTLQRQKTVSGKKKKKKTEIFPLFYDHGITILSATLYLAKCCKGIHNCNCM